MQRKLLILGAGQYGYIVRETAQLMGLFEEISFLDDANPLAIGKIADATKLRGQYTDAIVAIGNPVIRKQWIEQLLEIGYELPLIRHPHSIVMPSAKVEKGCIIEAQAVINSNAKVGTSCFICAGAVVNHNAIVEDYCQIDCNAVITAASRVSKELRIPCGQVY